MAFIDFPDGSELVLERFLKIGTGKAYDMRRTFERTLNELQERTHPVIVSKIEAFDPESTGNFDRGYNELVKWYRNKT